MLLNDERNKKIIVICILVIMLTIVLGLVFTLKKNKEDNKMSNNNNNISNNDKTANYKKMFNIYKSENKEKYQIVKKGDKFYEGYKYVSSYGCLDECYFGYFYFVHEDGRIDVFDESNGTVRDLTFVKKYELVNDLEVLKYTLDDQEYYYLEYDDNRELFKDIADRISIFYGDENVSSNAFVSSRSLLDENIYMLIEENNGKEEARIYKDNDLVHSQSDGVSAAGSSFNKLGSFYKTNYYGNVFILNDKFKRIVNYDASADSCIHDEDIVYCALNDSKKKSAKLVKYDLLGKETVIKNYKLIVGLSSELIVMGLSLNNNFEIYDIKNNKVLYEFNKLSNTQKWYYNDYFNNYSSYDEDNKIFKVFVSDSKLSKEDFMELLGDNVDYIYGYEYSYNIKNSEGKFLKKEYIPYN